jgi:glycosyltransferase involved in cell wall biosynthesis
MGARVSIFVQTLNEEANLARCLDSLRWTDDLVVLDSFSTDQSERIARSYGARWVQREYRGRAEHQNWAIDNIPFKHPWVYYSDADEVVPTALAEEIATITATTERPEVAYRVCRRDYFMGRWLRHSSQYPVWFVRLFRPDKIRWKRKANPVPEVRGAIGTLVNDYIHYPFSKGIADWLTRHNRYSTYEAEETLLSLAVQDFELKSLLSSDPTARRQALKTLSFRLPARPLFKFLYMYLARRGMLDGLPGFHYCLLQAFYEYQITLKVRELRSGRALGAGGPRPRPAARVLTRSAGRP